MGNDKTTEFICKIGIRFNRKLHTDTVRLSDEDAAPLLAKGYIQTKAAAAAEVRTAKSEAKKEG